MADDRNAQWEPEDTPRSEASQGRDSRYVSLAVIVILGLLIACSLWMVGTLRRSTGIQDCVMAGRMNCAPIQPTPR